MAYRVGNRSQLTLFPKSVEDYVKKDDVVRVYDAFVENLDVDKLGLKIDPSKEGNPEYDPKAMLKLLLYGYSYGHRSSRKLERAVHHNISFIWLMGGLKPDHKTISNFRKRNKKVLKQVFIQCAKLCIKMNLIEGNTLFVDGSKIRANASRDNTWTKEECKKLLSGINRKINQLLKECDKIDNQEEWQKSIVKIGSELADADTREKRIKEILKSIEEEEKNEINTTDRDALVVKGRQGIHAGYNSQIVVDEKESLIVNSDVVSDQTDQRQFANQIKQANEVLGKKCKIACADQGYSKVDELEKIDNEGIGVIVPPHETSANNVADKAFSKDKFEYVKESDHYVCPEGYKLLFYCRNNNFREYRIENPKLCLGCSHFGKCTKSKSGRHLSRLVNEDTKEKLKAQYLAPQSQAVFKLRKQKVEHPFGFIKRHLNGYFFLLRGLDGVRAEMSIFSTCFNLRRMITLCGSRKIIEAFTS